MLGLGYDSYGIVSIEADLKGEGEREANPEMRFHPPPVPLWVLFLSLPVTSEVR